MNFKKKGNGRYLSNQNVHGEWTKGIVMENNEISVAGKLGGKVSFYKAKGQVRCDTVIHVTNVDTGNSNMFKIRTTGVNAVSFLTSYMMGRSVQLIGRLKSSRHKSVVIMVEQIAYKPDEISVNALLRSMPEKMCLINEVIHPTEKAMEPDVNDSDTGEVTEETVEAVASSIMDEIMDEERRADAEEHADEKSEAVPIMPEEDEGIPVMPEEDEGVMPE